MRRDDFVQEKEKKKKAIIICIGLLRGDDRPRTGQYTAWMYTRHTNTRKPACAYTPWISTIIVSILFFNLNDLFIDFFIVKNHWTRVVYLCRHTGFSHTCSVCKHIPHTYIHTHTHAKAERIPLTCPVLPSVGVLVKRWTLYSLLNASASYSEQHLHDCWTKIAQRFRMSVTLAFSVALSMGKLAMHLLNRVLSTKWSH